MDNKFWDFAVVVAVCIFLYFVIKEIIPYCKEINVKRDANGNVEFTALNSRQGRDRRRERPPCASGKLTCCRSV